MDALLRSLLSASGASSLQRPSGESVEHLSKMSTHDQPGNMYLLAPKPVG